MKNFKIMETDGVVEIPVNEFADANGRLKVFLYENYRNGFHEHLVLAEDTIDARLDKLAEITLGNNTDKRDLNKSLVALGINPIEKSITAIDLIHAVKAGPDSSIIEGLLALYKEDEDFVLVVQEICDILNKSKFETSQEKLDKELKKYQGKYFIIIGGNTRFFLTRRRVKTLNEEGKSDGSENQTNWPIYLYNFSRLEDGEQITKINAKQLAGLDKEGREAYFALHHLYLLLMIFGDNANEKRNSSHENSLYAKGSLVQMIARNSSLYDEKHFDVRKLYKAMGPLWEHIKGFDINSRWIIWGLSYKLLWDANEAGLLKKEGKKNEAFTERDLTYCAKLIKTLITHVKCDKAENNCDRVSELTGINLKEAILVSPATLNKFLNLSVKCHKLIQGQDATYAKDAIQKVLNRKNQEEEPWFLSKEDEKEILEVVEQKSVTKKQLESFIDSKLQTITDNEEIAKWEALKQFLK